MKTYTVLAAFIDCDSRATVRVKANSYKEACEKACELIDSGKVSTQQESWDPDPVFVYGVVEGKGDPWNGVVNVPKEYERDAHLKFLAEPRDGFEKLRNERHELEHSYSGKPFLDGLIRERIAAIDAALPHSAQ